MLYPAQFEEELTAEHFSEGFVVKFRDVPQAITQSDTFIEAIGMAQDALRVAMQFYDERGDACPKPSDPQQGDVLIKL